MDERKQQYLELLNIKLGHLKHMLELTEKTHFTSSVDDEEALIKDAEEFANLYEGRGRIVTRIEKVDAELAKYKDLEGDKSIAKEVRAIAAKGKETAAAIVELDKKNMAMSSKFTGFVKGNLKKIRDGREMNNIYGDNLEVTSGHYFDSQN